MVDGECSGWGSHPKGQRRDWWRQPANPVMPRLARLPVRSPALFRDNVTSSTYHFVQAQRHSCTECCQCKALLCISSVCSALHSPSDYRNALAALDLTLSAYLVPSLASLPSASHLPYDQSRPLFKFKAALYTVSVAVMLLLCTSYLVVY
jgi:hypothetical protein